MSVTGIVPAYNEGKRIEPVLQALQVDEIGELIVVDDGSTDHTAEIAGQYADEVVQLSTNSGKSKALAEGVEVASNDTLLFMDADLLGLETSHVRQMIESYRQEDSDLVLGVFHNGRLNTDLSQKFNPFLTGQRVLSRDLWNSLDKEKVDKFGVEVAMAKLSLKQGMEIGKVSLEGVTHVMKEEKRGFGAGLKSRFKMYGDIIKSVFTKS